jgi:creatinine amidohydrolase/Fe(II)-dependent formamide hydrolase-like protein
MMETSEMLSMEPEPGAYVRPVYKSVPFDPTGQTPEQWKAARDARLARGQAGGAGAAQPAGGGGQRGQRGQNPNAPPRVNNGVTGDPRPSTKEIGKALIDITVNNAVAEIRKQMAGRRAATQ